MNQLFSLTPGGRLTALLLDVLPPVSLNYHQNETESSSQNVADIIIELR